MLSRRFYEALGLLRVVVLGWTAGRRFSAGVFGHRLVSTVCIVPEGKRSLYRCEREDRSLPAWHQTLRDALSGHCP